MNTDNDTKKHMILTWIITTIYTYVLAHTYETSENTPTSFLFLIYISRCPE